MQIKATATFRPRSDLGQFLAARVTPGARAGVEAAGNFILQEAQAIVPVDTGELRDSGKVELVETGSTVVARVAFTAGHAAYVEYGTGQRGAASPGAGDGPYSPTWPGMVAQPYLRPALDSGREVIQSLMASQIALSMNR